jgi:hypothetical protein
LPFCPVQRARLCPRRLVQRGLGTIVIKDRTTLQHAVERPLGDDQVVSRITAVSHHDGQPSAHEVAGDFVDLGQTRRRRPGRCTRRND